MVSNPLRLYASPIHFGTDGWRGVLGVDFTIERLLAVASASAQELLYRAPSDSTSRVIIIGYDRRFLAPELAEAIAAAVRGCGLVPLLSLTALPTPACSWGVVKHRALGALVLTASHNPPEWLGLKIKGPFGSSVEGDFTQAVENRLLAGGITTPIEEPLERLDLRKEHLDGLRSKFELPRLAKGLKTMGLKVFVDPMHGSAAGCVAEIFGDMANGLVQEIRSNRDPLFGGHPPEPLAPYLSELIAAVKSSTDTGHPAIGIVFDGDGDRIAAVDEYGNFCSTQLLMPLLIEHLVKVRNLSGYVVKTVSGSDLMKLVAEDFGRKVVELPVGFKYIASAMLEGNVLIGGEESGGVGFGIHIPERDALFVALLVLEALNEEGSPLGESLNRLKERFGKSNYQRLDLHLEDMESRHRLELLLENDTPNIVSGKPVKEVIRTDGVKLRMGINHWLMFRFSGTEPLLRIYCEAPTSEIVRRNLDWAKDLAKKI